MHPQFALRKEYVYRRCKLNPSQIQKYTEGTQFLWASFTSTTTQVDVDDEFGRVLFVIRIPQSVCPQLAPFPDGSCMCTLNDLALLMHGQASTMCAYHGY